MSHVVLGKIKHAHGTIGGPKSFGLGSFTKTREMLMDPRVRTGMLHHSSLCGGTQTSMQSWKQPVSSGGP